MLAQAHNDRGGTQIKRPAFAPVKRIARGKTLPPAYWRPYPRASIYKPIPGTEDGSTGNPSIHGSSASMITKITGWGNPVQTLVALSSSTGTFMDYNHPTYFASYSDPVFQVRMRTGGFTNSLWTTTSGPSFHCPQNALPARGTDLGDGDAHMGIVQPDGTEIFIYDCWANLAGTTRITALPGGGGNFYGSACMLAKFNGDGIRTSSDGTATAAAAASMYGPIRPEEMYARNINHALFLVCKSTDGTHVAPAAANAGTADPTNAPPCGARMQLNMTQSAIDAISDSSNSTGRWWNKAFLTAMRKYGGYFLDTSGASWAVQVTAGMSQYSLTGTDAWRTWAANTSPAMNYDATDDFYAWDIRTLVTWSSSLRILDWTDPLNH